MNGFEFFYEKLSTSINFASFNVAVSNHLYLADYQSLICMRDSYSLTFYSTNVLSLDVEHRSKFIGGIKKLINFRYHNSLFAAFVTVSQSISTWEPRAPRFIKWPLATMKKQTISRRSDASNEAKRLRFFEVNDNHF